MHAVAALVVFLTSAMAHQSFEKRTNSMTVQDASAKCGNGQVISCCNTSNQNGGSGGVLDNLGSGLLGGSCSPIPVNVIGVQVPIQQACGNNQAACCTGSQTGLVNVQCVPVGL